MEQDPRELADPASARFQVEKYPFYLLNRLVSRYNIVVESRLQDVGLDIPYWRVLMVLGQKSPRSIGQLAETTVIPVSTITRIVQRMTAAGLIGCAPLESDNRVVQVSLTPVGRKKLREARKRTAPIYSKVIQGLSPMQFEELCASLDRLHDNLAELVPAPQRQNGARAGGSRKRSAG
jgi:DNA-binding MarR family transcriptional regulator